MDTFARMRSIVGTTTEWGVNDLVLGDGEIAVEKAAAGVKLKVGNGALKFSQAPYLSADTTPGVYLPLAGGTMAGPITLPAAAGTGNQAISRATGDALYVKTTQLTQVGGAGQQNKVVQLDTNGLISPSMVVLSGNVTVKGTVRAVDPAPVGAAIGDTWVINEGGTLDASWTPVGGASMQVGDMLIRVTGNAWNILPSGSDLSGKVDVIGDSMLGPLHLFGTPTAADEAVSKGYVDTGNTAAKAYTDAGDALRVLKAGDTMTGPLKLADGTVTAPALTWASEPNTGWYRIGAQDIVFSLSGFKAVEWSAAGGYNLYTFNSPTNALLTVNKGTTTSGAGLRGQNQGVTRWQIDLGSAVAETGGNVGSDFQIYRYTDAGTFIGNAFTITRSAGLASFFGDVSLVKATPQLFFNRGSSGDTAWIWSYCAGFANWSMQLGDSSAGQAFTVNRYNPANGSYNGSPIWIHNGTGEMRLESTKLKLIGLPSTAAAPNMVWYTVDGQLFYSTSSLRYKKDIEDLNPEFSAKILQMRTVWFRSKCEADPPEWSYYGLIAEEVDKIDQRFVTYGRDEAGNKIPDGIQYDRLVVPLLAELQKLRKEFDTLLTRVGELEAKLQPT